MIIICSCRKAQESQREMKLLLDMYRSAPKEQRDKVQLMAAEKKAKSEVRFQHCTSLSPMHKYLVAVVLVWNVFWNFGPTFSFSTTPGQSDESTLIKWGISILLETIFCFSGRRNSTEAKGTGRTGEERGQKNGRWGGTKEDPLCGGADRHSQQEALHS